MEKITTKIDLIEKLKNIKGAEVIARRSYQEDMSTFKNKEMISKIIEIKNDKDRHIRMLDDLIVFLK